MSFHVLPQIYTDSSVFGDERETNSSLHEMKKLGGFDGSKQFGVLKEGSGGRGSFRSAAPDTTLVYVSIAFERPSIKYVVL